MKEQPLYTTKEGQEVFSTERNNTPEQIAEMVARSREADQENTRKNNPPVEHEGYMPPFKMTKEVRDKLNEGVAPEEFKPEEKQDDDLPLAA